MKLKNSFFNKTIFVKNITMYWPLWVVYTFIVMCMHPMVLLVEGSYINRVPRTINVCTRPILDV